jgi:hypothetical protein
MHRRRHDRRALGPQRPQAARVIEMLVRVHDVPDRLVRDQPVRFGDDVVRARLGQRSLNHHDMIREFDDEAVVRGGDQPDTVRKLSGLGRRGRRRQLRVADVQAR